MRDRRDKRASIRRLARATPLIMATPTPSKIGEQG